MSLGKVAWKTDSTSKQFQELKLGERFNFVIAKIKQIFT
jgi:hypothetical protein